MTTLRWRSRRLSGNRQDQTPLWLQTYGDMVTLLLAFFVLLYTFSAIDMQRFQEAVLSMQGALGVLQSGRTVIPDPARMDSPGKVGDLHRDRMIVLPDLEQMERLQEQIATALADLRREDVAELTIEERGLIIRFTDRVLFDTGRADLRADVLDVLNALAPVLREAPNDIRVEGHTDSRPIATFRFPSNWELSAARAAAVVRFLVESHGLDPTRISAAGYGPYRPLRSNDTEAGRRMNRRVDIVLLFWITAVMNRYADRHPIILDKIDLCKLDCLGGCAVMNESLANQATPSRGRRGNRWFLIGLLVFLLVVGAGATYALDLIDLVRGSVDLGASVGPVHSLETIVTNLHTPEGRPVVRLRVELELDGPRALESVKAREAAMLDAILSVLRTKEPQELMGPGGMQQLRKDLRSEFQRLLPEDSIRAVYFSEFIIQ